MLPDNVLDALCARIFDLEPSLRLQFLSALGSRMHASAIRVLFRNVMVEDDMRVYSSSDGQAIGPLAALLHNAARYGSAVQCLTICDPQHFDDLAKCSRDVSSLLQLSSSDDSDSGDAATVGRLIEPLSADRVVRLLAACSNLVELVWTSSTPPPNGLCEALARHCPKLARFAFAPLAPLGSHQVTTHSQGIPPRWDAPSLPLLESLPIRVLHLHRLSQEGARALGSLLSKLGDNSSIEELSLNFLWLDDALCNRIVEASKKLQRLCLSTNGTKLTDRGVLAVAAIEGLEELKLREVEGRLSKKLWQSAQISSTLTCLSVNISELGPHHSWISDHLVSLSQASFSSLTSLRITRTIHPFINKLDDVAALQLLPSDFTLSIKEAKALQILECDWWAWPGDKLKEAVDSCKSLQVLRFAFDGPFAKFLTLTSTFAAAYLLKELYVYISPIHAPLATAGAQVHPLTPSASPVISSMATLPVFVSACDPHTIEDRFNSSNSSSDPYLPPLREMKKFLRRCQALSLLDWYGWNGRGSWSVSRPPGVARSTVSTTIEYIPPPRPGYDLLKLYALEEEAARVGWLPGAADRQGQIWTGVSADEYMRERQAQQRERDELQLMTPIKTKTRKVSSTVSSNPPASPDTPKLPPTPTSLKKESLSATINVRKNPTPADSRIPKTLRGHKKHRRATTDSSIQIESDRRYEGQSSRRKSLGMGPGVKVSSAPTRSGHRQGRVAKINNQSK